jgi:hypothetical protein
LRAEKFLHFFTGRALIFIEFAVTIFIKLFEHGIAHILLRCCITTTLTRPGLTAAGPSLTTAGSGLTTAGSGLTTAGPGLTTAGSGLTTAGSGLTTAGSGLTTAKLGTEKLLHFFAGRALIFIKLAVTILIIFLDHGFPDTFTTATFATTATLSWAILGLCSQTECH